MALRDDLRSKGIPESEIDRIEANPSEIIAVDDWPPKITGEDKQAELILNIPDTGYPPDKPYEPYLAEPTIQGPVVEPKLRYAWEEEKHPRDEEGKFASIGEQLDLNSERIENIKQNHLLSKATYPMNGAGAYFEDNLPQVNSFQQFQTEEELFDMKEAMENGNYEKSDALFLEALKKQPKALGNFKEISEDLAGFNEAMKAKTANAKEIYRFTDTGELDSYLEKDAKFGASGYATGKNADYKCLTLEPFNKFFREGSDVVVTYPTDTLKENMTSAEYSAFPRSEAYGNKKPIDNEKSGRYALETEIRVKSDTKVPVGKLHIEFTEYMSFDTVKKYKEKYSSLGTLNFPNASRDFIDK